MFHNLMFVSLSCQFQVKLTGTPRNQITKLVRLWLRRSRTLASAVPLSATEICWCEKPIFAQTRWKESACRLASCSAGHWAKAGGLKMGHSGQKGRRRGFSFYLVFFFLSKPFWIIFKSIWIQFEFGKTTHQSKPIAKACMLKHISTLWYILF
jgi:hypothetical protein